MAKAKQPFVPFQRLTWKDGESVPMPDTPEPTTDKAARAALMALAGFECRVCGKTLTEANGYACCYRAYCPYCGDATCAHWLVRDAGSEAYFNLWYVRPGQELTEASRERWRKLRDPTPPASRLSAQKGSGYPVWSPEQRREAYASHVEPYLEAIFGPHLRSFAPPRLNRVLVGACLYPDVQTMLRNQWLQTETRYFSADPTAAIGRAERFLTELAEGTERLRAGAPAGIVRAGKKGP